MCHLFLKTIRMMNKSLKNHRILQFDNRATFCIKFANRSRTAASDFRNLASPVAHLPTDEGSPIRTTVGSS